MIDIDKLANRIVLLLKERSMRLAVAESCTGGLLSSKITAVSGASAVFDCCVVSYSNEIKAELLSVNRDDLIKYGAVSEAVARGMAKGVRALAKADIAVAITGIAGPLSDNTNKPVGLIYIAVDSEKKCNVREFRSNFTEDIRNANRFFAVENALKMIEEYILNG